jgi:hypothetical protein
VAMALVAQAAEPLAVPVRAEAGEVMEAGVPAVLVQPGPPVSLRAEVSECLVLEEPAQAQATEWASDSANPLQAAEAAGEEAPPPGSDRMRCRLRRGALSAPRTAHWTRRRPGS